MMGGKFLRLQQNSFLFQIYFRYLTTHVDDVDPMGQLLPTRAVGCKDGL